jgi:hypothetical protein
MVSGHTAPDDVVVVMVCDSEEEEKRMRVGDVHFMREKERSVRLILNFACFLK